MKKTRLIVSLVVLVALVVFAIWAQSRVHFNFASFRAQLSDVDWLYIIAAIACIYGGYVVRSVRWALLMRHNKKVPVFSLVGPQIIGFTGVALLGRFADLTRPYLVSKKTGEPLTSQIGVYVVERLFDLGAMAVYITCAVWLMPVGSLSHPEVVENVKRGFLIATGAGAVFMVSIRVAGDAVAGFFVRAFGLVSKKLGHAVGHRLRVFHEGLNTIRTYSDFGIVSALSLLNWFLILLAYFETARAFRADPHLAVMSMAQSMVIVACSGGASFLQPPIIGWFWQIGAVGEAIHGFLGVGREAAWACSTMLLVDTFLSVLPVGLVWAQFTHVSLRKIAAESEHEGESFAEEEQTETSGQNACRS
ncbi:MAG TPA: lysylphosphatidylglycerol synthase transmembrane domain-containing protein [Terracidiphilus sp.]|nr:lysylphosphatidylglycerol synthase transmembrane domain-containing protein [Terracidiphilus sp.]